MDGKIIIHGARQHNLKSVHLELPRNKFIVVTGVSGSGKSSLAFDTIYAEGQRRYVESLSAYARQFLELMDKPDVDYILGLTPAISIEQRAPSHNPRSTVATQTEIYDYLRLVFARIGIAHCSQCSQEIRPTSASQIIAELIRDFGGKEIALYAPLVRGRIGTYEELLKKLRREGWVRVRIDGQTFSLDGRLPQLSRYKKHTIEIEVDRLKVQAASKERLADSVETCLNQARGLIQIETKTKKILKSEKYSCPQCGLGLIEMEPRLFSFNSPYGACPACEGLGSTLKIDPDLVIPDQTQTIKEGALHPWSDPITTRTHRWKNSWGSYYFEILEQVCRRNNIPRDVPWKRLDPKHKQILLYGGGTYKIHWAKNESDFEGVVTNLERRHKETESDFVKEEIYRRYMRRISCGACLGLRLKKEALSVTVGGLNIAQVTAKSITQTLDFFEGLKLSAKELEIVKQALKEITGRLSFMKRVSLGYLTLNRESQTLAGGEAQRMQLATQIGSGLVGVTYILDEPTIGLHPRDNHRLLEVLRHLRDAGNTLIVVEHDEDTIRASDWIVDLGPAGGEFGGSVVFSGPSHELLKAKNSLTAFYLKGEKKIVKGTPLRSPKAWLRVLKARQFNLKSIDVSIPLGVFVSVTGVSGSGKSTLVHEVLYKALAKKLYSCKDEPGRHERLEGIDNIDKVLLVDQDPIGRTPRSNPATYTDVWTPIRELFAQLPEARRRGYKPGRFSFNVKGGRCENCRGEGLLKIEMQFLADVYISCDLCKGLRFNEETLEVKFHPTTSFLRTRPDSNRGESPETSFRKSAFGGLLEKRWWDQGKSIADILNLSASEALKIFSDFPQMARILKTLEDVGLGYIKLGQPATTLSGGEAQRVKLALELSKRATGRTLYILDEPTTGLHFDDVSKLLAVLHRLVDQGNTVLVIEHNLEVVKTADWIIDLGPEGGEAGGYLVAEGLPEEIMKSPKSYTGEFLGSRLYN